MLDILSLLATWIITVIAYGIIIISSIIGLGLLIFFIVNYKEFKKLFWK